MLSRSYGEATDSTNQLSGTWSICVNNGLVGILENFAIGSGDKWPDLSKITSGSSTKR